MSFDKVKAYLNTNVNCIFSFDSGTTVLGMPSVVAEREQKKTSMYEKRWRKRKALTIVIIVLVVHQ